MGGDEGGGIGGQVAWPCRWPFNKNVYVASPAAAMLPRPASASVAKCAAEFEDPRLLASSSSSKASSSSIAARNGLSIDS